MSEDPTTGEQRLRAPEGLLRAAPRRVTRRSGSSTRERRGLIRRPGLPQPRPPDRGDRCRGRGAPGGGPRPLFSAARSAAPQSFAPFEAPEGGRSPDSCSTPSRSATCSRPINRRARLPGAGRDRWHRARVPRRVRRGPARDAPDRQDDPSRSRGAPHPRSHGRRVPKPAARDEVAELANTLEEMLTELGAARSETEAALLRQRAFVADASHELRTPLTSILPTSSCSRPSSRATSATWRAWRCGPPSG